MSIKDLLSVTNILYIVGGIYFLAIAGLNEGSVYSAVVGVLCLVAAALAVSKESFLSVSWRVASAAFALVLLAAQLIADYGVPVSTSTIAIVSILVNAVLLVLFIGVTLSSLYDIVKKESEEEKKEEEREEEQERRKREAKKITYEV